MPVTIPSNSSFLTDVLKGLTGTPKSIPSKYLYDGRGDQLFRMIMTLPEYYLTRTEHEILRIYARRIAERVRQRHPIQIIELGAGDGTKTKLLIKELLAQRIPFEYIPIDIAGSALELLNNSLELEFGMAFPIHPIEGEYFEALASEDLQRYGNRLILFLGSTIGNFQPREASDFMGRLSEEMIPGDKLLVGFDLKKDPQTILNAYNDREGITAEFNLNLLTRINNELDADFDLTRFAHYPLYDPVQGAAKSYLISLCDQEVWLGAADQKLFFRAYESIFTEVSQKFDHYMISDYARRNNLEIGEVYSDSRGMFADVLFEKL